MTVAIFFDKNPKRSGVDNAIMNLKPGTDYEKTTSKYQFSLVRRVRSELKKLR